MGRAVKATTNTDFLSLVLRSNMASICHDSVWKSRVFSVN